jgi:hypothetical protein
MLLLLLPRHCPADGEARWDEVLYSLATSSPLLSSPLLSSHLTLSCVSGLVQWPRMWDMKVGIHRFSHLFAFVFVFAFTFAYYFAFGC